MQTQRDNLVLIIAFAAAVGLHVLLLPWVGQAVGEESQDQVGIDILVQKLAGTFYFAWASEIDQADPTIDINGLTAVEANDPELARTLLSAEQLDRVDAVWLSRDRQLDDADLELFRRMVPGIDAIETHTPFAQALPVPTDADGPYWLIYQADINEQVPDANRANNTRVAPLYIDGPQRPELAIQSFHTPEHAVVGGSFRIDFAIQNLGDGWASSNPELGEHGWTDRIYLSTDARLDPTDLPLRSVVRTAPLGPTQGYRHDLIELELPRGITGPMHLILAADADQLLDQPSFIKGYAIRPIELIDTHRPDLGVTAITNPSRLVIGRPSPIAFSIANAGSVPTVDSNWADAVYLSRDDQLDEGDRLLISLPAGQPLQPNSQYESIAELTLPESVELGAWHLIVKADAQNEVDEAVFEGNNTFAVPIEVWTQAQADAEIKLGSPDRPDRLVVQWIENDRVEKHIARRSRTVQPALQSKAEPDPNAPLVDHPKPPTLAAVDRPAGSPNRPAAPVDPTTPSTGSPPPDATASDVAPRPQAASSPASPQVQGLPDRAGDLPAPRDGVVGPTTPNLPNDPTPSTQDSPSKLPGDRDVPSPADPTAPNTDATTDSQTPAETESDTDSNNPEETDTTEQTDNPTADPTTSPKPDVADAPTPEGDDANPATPSEEQTPTRAPKDDSEAPPTDIKITELELQEGQVLVGKGIKVTTKLPTPPGTGSRVLSIPRNARVSITFDNKGKVFEAKVIRSTTYKEWDAAIEASLYRWSAKGEAIDNAKPHVTIEWDYLLNDLFDE